MEWNGMKWNARTGRVAEWNEMECANGTCGGMEWNGMEWNARTGRVAEWNARTGRVAEWNARTDVWRNGMNWNARTGTCGGDGMRERTCGGMEWNYTVVGPILIIIAPSKSGSQIPFSG